jgi:hypothetical protein
VRRESVRRVHLYVQANAVRCIPRVPLRPDRVRSELDPDFHLQDPFVPEAVRELLREGPVSATFPAV